MSPNRFIGAAELGLVTKWRFRFVPPGTVVQPVPGVVYIDVGGSLRPGIIDHHQGSGVRSGAEAVLFNRELIYNHLMGEWLRRAEEGRVAPGTVWTPTVVTHFSPDWDAMVATFLATTLIETGDFPAGSAALVAYATEVDQGAYTLDITTSDGMLAPHLAYLALQHLTPATESEQLLGRGFELLRVTLGAASTLQVRVTDFRPPSSVSLRWTGDPSFSDAKELLLSDYEKFRSDENTNLLKDSVRLPLAGGGSAEVRGFACSRPPESALQKYWFRAHGYPFLICPFGTAIDGDSRNDGRVSFPRVIISVDPNHKVEGRPLTLEGLGYALENAETTTRRRIGRGIDARGGAPRFGNGYCENEDPWYDGRGHDFTIVDAPKAATVLPYHEIVQIATSGHFWEAKVRSSLLTIVRRDERRDVSGSALPAFDAMSAALRPFCEDSSECQLEGPHLPDRFADRFTVTRTQCRFPDGTAPPLEITRVEGAAGTTLEELIEVRDSLVSAREADYVFARVSLGSSFAPSSRVNELLQTLGGGELRELESAHNQKSVLLLGGRTLIVSGDERSSPTSTTDPEFMILLYVAFLCEALSEYERDISRAVSPGADVDSDLTRVLRQNFVRFQTRYFGLEIARTARGRKLAATLMEAMSVAERYEEVQRELDRLAELEAQLAAKRQARADAVMQAILYFINVCFILQTIVAFLGWSGLSWRALWWVSPLVLTSALIYVLILRMGRRRDSIERSRAVGDGERRPQKGERLDDATAASAEGLPASSMTAP